MKTFVPISIFVAGVLAVDAQQQQAVPAGANAGETERVLEAKIRKAWDDFKNKRKEAFAAIFTEDAVEVEEGADGVHDKKATLAEMDAMDMTSFSVTDFHYRRIGSDGLLVRYAADYSATLGGEAIHNKSIIGEVWERTADDWKLVYFQETKVK